VIAYVKGTAGLAGRAGHEWHLRSSRLHEQAEPQAKQRRAGRPDGPGDVGPPGFVTSLVSSSPQRFPRTTGMCHTQVVGSIPLPAFYMPFHHPA